VRDRSERFHCGRHRTYGFKPIAGSFSR
jgi:hypothetical protein